MQTLTQLVLKAGLAGRVLRDRQFRDWFQDSDQRRYNLVNRALRAGELVRLTRGVYVIHPDIARSRPHAFVVAQILRPGSFLSFESALAWYDCIPEAVSLHASVVPGRRAAEFSVPLYGDFRFVPLALRPGRRLVGVRRLELAGGVALIAEPLRALLDLICWRKIEPGNAAGFVAGLRLDPEFLAGLNDTALDRFRAVYRHHRMSRVLDELARLGVDHD
jgi:hypothetical protein